MNTKQEKNNVEKEGWNADVVGKESSYEDSTEIKQRILRADETKGDPNTRDIAGVAPYEETPQGNNELENNQEKGKKAK